MNGPSSRRGVPSSAREDRRRGAAGTLGSSPLGVGSLAERLRQERRQQLLGRAPELSRFERSLEDRYCSLLFVRGQVGVGKTALLAEFHALAERRGHPVLAADLRALAAPGSAARGVLQAQTFERWPPGGPRGVLLLDGFEWLSPGDPWFFLELLPALPADVLVVVTSRAPAPRELSLDPGWRRLAQELPLAPLDDVASELLLFQLGVGRDSHEKILDFAAGYPLALTLAAECAARSATRSFDVEALQEAQSRLSRSLCPDELSPGQQLAVDLCSVARVTTADLLDHVQAALGYKPDVERRDPFGWLSRQSFIESRTPGLVPHVLLRVAVHARLRRERPRRHRAITFATREFFVGEMETGAQVEADFLSVTFLDRDIPFVRQWNSLMASADPEPFRAAGRDDWGAIVELIRDKEGAEAAELAQAAVRREGHQFEVTGRGHIQKVCHGLRIRNDGGLEALDDRDPVSKLVRADLARAPLQGDEEAVLSRWSFDRDVYQTPSPAVLSLTARQVYQALASKRMARTYTVHARLEEWQEILTGTGVPWRFVERFVVGPRVYSLVAVDWKRRSPRELLLHTWELAERRRPPWSFVAQEGAPAPPAASFQELRAAVGDRVAKLSRQLALTPREAEILEQLCLGTSLEEIAQRFSIRPRTVKFHQENLLRKAGVKSRLELFRKLL